MLLSNACRLPIGRERVSVVADVFEAVIGAGRAEPLKVLAASINFSRSTTDKLSTNYPYSVLTSNFLFIKIFVCKTVPL